MSRLDSYLQTHADSLHMMPSIKAILADAKDALSQLPAWERGFHIFWLLGPFILLIERTPADIWLSILALAFVVRSLVKRDGAWLNVFWVKAGFVFWLWCLFAAGISSDPSYALGEAVVWFRFPLFAMATAFWLAKDKRLLYAMLMSTAAGLIVMCGILSAEILIVGQQHNRLSWPYGDLTPGNYVAKVGLPAFTIMVALAVSVKGRVAGFSGLIALFTVMISVMTGERINFLIRACGGMLAGLVWKPKWNRYLLLVVMEVLAVVLVFTLEPDMAKRYTDEFIAGAFYFETSGWMHAMNGGYLIGLDNPIVGIGTANFRNMAPILLEGVPYTQIQPHPHNYYVQMFCETGLIGLALGSLFLWAIVGSCFKSSFKNRDNVVLATSWVIPFGLFWPIATSADFFGQWNNIFMWSAVALAVAANNLVPKTD